MPVSVEVLLLLVRIQIANPFRPPLAGWPSAGGSPTMSPVLFLPAEGRFCLLATVACLGIRALKQKVERKMSVWHLATTLRKWPLNLNFAASSVVSNSKNTERPWKCSPTFPQIAEKSGRCEICVRTYLARQISVNFSSGGFVKAQLLFNSSSEHLSPPFWHPTPPPTPPCREASWAGS